MTTYDHEPPRNADGAPACEDCGATRLRTGSSGYAVCLGCGSRYAATASAAMDAGAWQHSSPDAQMHGALADTPTVPRTPTSAELMSNRSLKRRSSFVGMIVAAAVGVTAWFVFGGGRPSDCQPIAADTVVDLANGIMASEVDSAASLARDGGKYIVASVPGKDAEVVWFQTPSGTTYSVGAVTALYSTFPDAAAYTRAGVGTDGYDDAKACVG